MLHTKFDKFISVISICIIAVIPLLTSFLSIDIVDTGYYLYQYSHLTAENVSYSTYLATIIGAGWLYLFDGLGVWGLNLLEVFLEWVLALIVYLSFRKKLGSSNTLLGIALCILMLNTYVNIFNYHQLNMFFCTSMLCCMYHGLINNKKRALLLSGIFGSWAIATRFPSILSLVCILCIIYWLVIAQRKWRILFQSMLTYLAGYIVGGGLYVIIIYKLGVGQNIINDVFRMNSLSGSDNSIYGIDSMISNFVKDTAGGLYVAALIFSSTLLIVVIGSMVRRKSFNDLFCLIFGLMLLPVALWVIFVLGGAPHYVQLTSFQWEIYGVVLSISLAFMIRGMLSRNRDDKENGLIAILGIALCMLCFVGAAARVKHIILGLWIILPFIISRVRELYQKNDLIFTPFSKINCIQINNKGIRKGVIYFASIHLIAVIIFIVNTNNFDSTNRTELTHGVEVEQLKYLQTTERQSQEMEGVLDILETTMLDEKQELMIVGNSMIYYFLADMDAYVKPWVTGNTYATESFKQDINEAEELNQINPIIVEAKTDSYLGFDDEVYEDLYTSYQQNDFNGKRAIIEQFKNENDYYLVYESEYYMVYDSRENYE